MCGRFALVTPGPEIARLFNLDTIPTFEARYNIAPTQVVVGVRATTDERRELAALLWGLVPHWAKDASIGSRMINARSETVAEKPAFRTPFRRRRCLIPADGYYEWAKTAAKQKQPYFIRFRDGEPFAFAGLWDAWEQGADAYIESCTLLTTEANALTRRIHDRMPVILRPQDFNLWLDPTVQRPERLVHLFAPYPSEEMEAFPVSLRVNNPSNDDPTCVEPLVE
jgi:putative SOS response-associated peptidase YedK